MNKISKKKIQSLYPDKSQKIQEYMLSIYKYIIKTYGSINDEYMPSLNMLADNLSMFEMTKKEIAEQGLLIPSARGGQEKNPLLKVQTDSQIQFLKLLQEFGLSPKSAKKIQGNNENSNDMAELAEILG